MTVVGATHQTVRLTRGAHRSPDDGACAVELASMLAGEPFSDHPEGVCPVIAAFLRAYNDHVDERRRQDLYPCAARVVGTRASADVERLRAALCMRWSHEVCDRPPLRVRVLHRLLRSQGPDIDAVYAARAAAASRPGRATHWRALQFVGDLVEVGTVSRGSAHASPRQRDAPEPTVRS